MMDVLQFTYVSVSTYGLLSYISRVFQTQIQFQDTNFLSNKKISVQS